MNKKSHRYYRKLRMTARYFQEAPQVIPGLETLVDVILFDFSNQFNISPQSVINSIVHLFGRLPAIRFAKIMQQFDRLVSEKSIWEAAREVLHEFTDGWVVNTQSEITASGPMLVVANHPGMADSLAAMAAVPRSDQSMIVIERPILVAMPNASRNMIFVDEENPLRIDLVRKVIKKLQDGETVIMFPRGNLEPDPALTFGATDTLGNWSASIGLFLSKVLDTILQPLLISNVYAPKAWFSQVSRQIKTPKLRQQVSMVLQVAMQRVFPKGGWKIPIHVTIPPPLATREISSIYDPHELNDGVIAYMRELIQKEFPDYSLQDAKLNQATQ